MTCKVTVSEDGKAIKFECGPNQKPTDHECDLKGPWVEFEDGLGGSASCSICGRLAYDDFDMWSF